MRPLTSNKGFTLIEILVALAIFGLLSIGAYSVLDAGMRSKQQTESRLDSLAVLQRAVQTIEKDLQMLSLRRVRDDLGDQIPLLRGESEVSGQASFIEFTRANWRNPAGLPRSNLQHIHYRFEQQKLIRTHSIFLDQASNSAKVERTLLEDVNAMHISFLDASDQWQSSWSMFSASSKSSKLPKAVKISFELETFGLIERLIAIDLVAPSEPSTDTGSGDNNTGDQQ